MECVVRRVELNAKQHVRVHLDRVVDLHYALMDVRQVERWSSVVERIEDRIRCAPVDLDFRTAVLAVFAVAAAVQHDSIERLAVDRTSFDCLGKTKESKRPKTKPCHTYSCMLAVVVAAAVAAAVVAVDSSCGHYDRQETVIHSWAWVVVPSRYSAVELQQTRRVRGNSCSQDHRIYPTLNLATNDDTWSSCSVPMVTVACTYWYFDTRSSAVGTRREESRVRSKFSWQAHEC